jgi:hypothetical protein
MTAITPRRGLLLGTILLIALVALASGYGIATASESATTNRQVREITLRTGDYVYMPGLDLQCNYGRILVQVNRLELDCGRRSTEMTGVRIRISGKVAELYDWEEVQGWKRLARARRNP